jgi:hypothetical protein
MANPSILQEIPLIEKAYLQYMHNQFMRAAGTAGDTLLKNKNFATNTLKQSITGGAELQGSLIIGSFGANTAYAEDMETGETKRNPTVSEIYSWVVRKVALGHIKLKEWIDSKRNFVEKTGIQNKRRKLSLETTMMNIAKKTALNISISGKLKSAKPYLQPAHAQLIRNLDADFPLEIN